MIKKKIGILVLFATLFSLGINAQRATSIRINEILVVNEDNYVDDYGKHSGWIELFNSSAGTVDLKGCYITNDKNNLTKYMIPKGDVLTKIRPRQHTIFFADNNPGRGTFHVNFVLDPYMDNYIAIVDADGKTLIDGVVNTISFAVNKTVTITQNTSSYSSLAYIVVNGTTYNSTQTLNFPSGTIITAYAASESSRLLTRIDVDRVTVASGRDTQISYNYTLQTNCTIYFDKTSSRGRITITSV